MRLLVLVLVAERRSGMRLRDVQQLVQQQVSLFCPFDIVVHLCWCWPAADGGCGAAAGAGAGG
jgi:hypothetical protein